MDEYLEKDISFAKDNYSNEELKKRTCDLESQNKLFLYNKGGKTFR